LHGTLYPRPVGSYRYEKWGDSYHVTVFLTEVTAVADEWPERELRQRRWFRPSRALARIGHHGLYEIVQNAFENERVHGALG
jgi:hypothetical protein